MTDPHNPGAGWYPDPTGRYQTRYWDGSSWTDEVADDGLKTVDQAGGPGPTNPPLLLELEPVAPRRPPPKGRLAIGVGLVVVLAAVTGVAFVLLRDEGDTDGVGEFSGQVESDGVFVHSVKVAEDSIVLFEVVDGPEFDAVLGISADQGLLDEYQEFFVGEIFDFETPQQLFSHAQFDDLPGRLFLGADQGPAGQGEVQILPAPFGADLDVLVSGAGGQPGEFDLEVSVLHYEGPDDGEEYRQAYFQDESIREFLEAELPQLEEPEEPG